jgi:hypothetical protein
MGYRAITRMALGGCTAEYESPLLFQLTQSALEVFVARADHTEKDFQIRTQKLWNLELERQVVSVITRFALVAVALAIAIDAKILPWSIDDTEAAVIACMQRWVNQRGNINAAGELLQEVERRRRTISTTINDRYIHLRVEGRRLVPAVPADQSKMNAADKFDGCVKEGSILVAKGDVDGAQRMLEHLQTIPFEMTVGEREPSPRCASESEETGE